MTTVHGLVSNISTTQQNGQSVTNFIVQPSDGAAMEVTTSQAVALKVNSEVVATGELSTENVLTATVIRVLNVPAASATPFPWKWVIFGVAGLIVVVAAALIARDLMGPKYSLLTQTTYCGKPFQNAPVKVLDQQSNVVASGTTDTQGRFEAQRLKAGPYIVNVNNRQFGTSVGTSPNSVLSVALKPPPDVPCPGQVPPLRPWPPRLKVPPASLSKVLTEKQTAISRAPK